MGLTPKQQQVFRFIESYWAQKGYAPTQEEIARHFKFRSINSVQNHLVRLEKAGLLSRTWNGKRSLTLKKIKTSDFASASASVSSAQEYLHSSHFTESAGALVGTTVGTSDLDKGTRFGLKGQVGGRSDLHKESSVFFLPLLGSVAAGRPLEVLDPKAGEEAADRLAVPSFMIHARGDKNDHFALRVVGDSMIEDGIFEGDWIIVKKQATVSNGEMVVALVDDAATVKRFFKKGDTVELHPANPAYQPIKVVRGQKIQIEGIVTGVLRKV